MVINPIVGVYIPIVRIPIKGGMTIPNIATFDPGTHVLHKKRSCTIQRKKLSIKKSKDERFEESDVCSGCKYIVLNGLVRCT